MLSFYSLETYDLETPTRRYTFALGLTSAVLLDARVGARVCEFFAPWRPLEGGDLRVRWGSEEDAFDPLTQIRQASVAFETAGTSITDVVPTREYTLQELRLLSKAAGFVDMATYGALDPEFVAADDDELAYRLVVVLTA